MYLDHGQRRIDELGCVEDEARQPCTEEEVASLEEALGFRVPGAYRELLLWAGKGLNGEVACCCERFSDYLALLVENGLGPGGWEYLKDAADLDRLPHAAEEIQGLLFWGGLRRLPALRYCALAGNPLSADEIRQLQSGLPQVTFSFSQP